MKLYLNLANMSTKIENDNYNYKRFIIIYNKHPDDIERQMTIKSVKKINYEYCRNLEFTVEYI